MAEELTAYLADHGIQCNYIHSDVDTLERVKIMEELRAGTYDVLIGVNLLREGLDLPEVSLVAILDADKEGFLRSHRSLTQTAGRAARNVHGTVIMYADRITESMQQTIDETNRRREKQLAYNEAHGITPKQIVRARRETILSATEKAQPAAGTSAPSSAYGYDKKKTGETYAAEEAAPYGGIDPILQKMDRAQLEKAIRRTEQLMKEAADKLEFVQAAQYRDEMFKLKALYGQQYGA